MNPELRRLQAAHPVATCLRPKAEFQLRRVRRVDVFGSIWNQRPSQIASQFNTTIIRSTLTFSSEPRPWCGCLADEAQVDGGSRGKSSFGRRRRLQSCFFSRCAVGGLLSPPSGPSPGNDHWAAMAFSHSAGPINPTLCSLDAWSARELQPRERASDPSEWC